MKTCARLRIAMFAFILVFMVGVWRGQASQKQEGAASIQTSANWFTDYLEQTGDVGAFTSIAFDPGNGIPWISYYDSENTALKVAHYKGSGGNCGPDNNWYCETVDSDYNVGRNLNTNCTNYSNDTNYSIGFRQEQGTKSLINKNKKYIRVIRSFVSFAFIYPRIISEYFRLDNTYLF